MEKKSSHKFRRQNWFRYKRLGEKWRRPRGKDSRLRVRFYGKGKMVSLGFRVPKATRGLHPSGYAEVIVSNAEDVAKLNANNQIARIAASVGSRKRQQILAKAAELKVRILNPGVVKYETRLKEKASS